MPPKIAFHMIVFNSDYVLRECLESVLPYGPVIATEGPVAYYQRLGYSTSTDQTSAILDEYGIDTLHGQWPEKDAMVNAGLDRIPPDTDFIWVLDSDEIWRAKDIQLILAILAGGEVDSMSFRAWSFYAGFDSIMGGFEESFEVHRIQRWYPGAIWQTHRPPTIMAPDGRPWREHGHMHGLQTDALGLRFWHYSYLWPSQMRMKAAYYAAHDPGGTIPDYFNRVYLPWAMGDQAARAAIEDEFDGVHNWLPARRGPARTRRFGLQHPQPILFSMPELQARFDRELEAYIP